MLLIFQIAYHFLPLSPILIGDAEYEFRNAKKHPFPLWKLVLLTCRVEFLTRNWSGHRYGKRDTRFLLLFITYKLVGDDLKTPKLVFCITYKEWSYMVGRCFKTKKLM